MRRLLLLVLFAGMAFSSSRAQQRVRLVPGLVISSDAVIEPGEYLLPSDSTGAIILRGNDFTVDFSGAVLIGSPNAGSPDLFHGTGIRIEGGRGVTLRGATVRGYRLGVWATDVEGLRIEGGDFSYNYRQRLKSTVEREHLDDWMSYHQNEADEWMRYGAAIYVRGARSLRVEGISVTGGQNGILLTKVNDSIIQNNAITFNSGIGVGLYRSSRNLVRRNALDFNVRGYSHGVYNRGQDSAAILVYEQSNENTFSFNSATHSGDGLFLWAGQTTMDTGEGGCNDNLILGNDFSYAPTNGIEVTFSRNRIVGNTIVGCWHGIWGGYSYDTEISGNRFADNDEHIAVEHGQDLTIERNVFSGGAQGIRLWERAAQPGDWGYAQARDVRSRDAAIRSNLFDGVRLPLRIDRTTGLGIEDNVFAAPTDSIWIHDSETVSFGGNLLPTAEPEALFKGGFVPGESQAAARLPIDLKPVDAAPVPQGLPFPAGVPRGRRYMLVDQWGPHDFRSPVIWPRSPRNAAEQDFEILGPTGNWRVVSIEGAGLLSEETGTLPGLLRLALAQEGVIDVAIELEYAGEAVTDRFGRATAAGLPFRFAYRYSFVPIEWDVRFFAYDDDSEPRSHPAEFAQLLKSTPLYRESTRSLGYQWYRAPAPGVPQDRFATLSLGTLAAPEGDYLLEITSDDGVRVWLDGQVIHDDWTYHAPRLAEIPVRLGGEHLIRIEHFEIDGYSTLTANLRQKP